MADMVATVTLKIEMCTGRLVDALAIASEQWPASKRAEFYARWSDLVDAGAEWVEVQAIGNRIVGYPSEDLTAHCAAYGVYP
jgi:hypothetical protein